MTLNTYFQKYILPRREWLDLTPWEVAEITARYYGYDLDTVTGGPGREKRIREARKTAMYLVRRFCGLTFRDTAEVFGVVPRAIQQAWDGLHQTPDPNAAGEIEDITALLKTAALVKYDEQIPF